MEKKKEDIIEILIQNNHSLFGVKLVLVSFCSVMRIKPTHDGPSFDVVVIVDPLSKGIYGLVEVISFL